jgi:hypothetical protein
MRSFASLIGLSGEAVGTFVHFGLSSYSQNDAEYQAVFPFQPGCVPAPSRFNPEQLNAE